MTYGRRKTSRLVLRRPRFSYLNKPPTTGIRQYGDRLCCCRCDPHQSAARRYAVINSTVDAKLGVGMITCGGQRVRIDDSSWYREPPRAFEICGLTRSCRPMSLRSKVWNGLVAAPPVCVNEPVINGMF